MTGPEHYKAAEQLIEVAQSFDGEPLTRHVQAGQLAQAHAILALAAAHAVDPNYSSVNDPNTAAWLKAAGTS